MKEPFSFRLRLFRIGEAVFLRLSSLRRKRKAHRYEITRRKPFPYRRSFLRPDWSLKTHTNRDGETTVKEKKGRWKITKESHGYLVPREVLLRLCLNNSVTETGSLGPTVWRLRVYFSSLSFLSFDSLTPFFRPFVFNSFHGRRQLKTGDKGVITSRRKGEKRRGR